MRVKYSWEDSNRLLYFINRTEELKCGGMVVEVGDMFSAVVSAVVQQASTEAALYRDSVLLLSICPFSWHEERCVMRSSLVSLLDKLCCMRNEKSESAVSLFGMAWAGFQVLLDRIVQWENDKGQISCIFLFLAKQALKLLFSRFFPKLKYCPFAPDKTISDCSVLVFWLVIN